MAPGFRFRAYFSLKHMENRISENSQYRGMIHITLVHRPVYLSYIYIYRYTHTTLVMNFIFIFIYFKAKILVLFKSLSHFSLQTFVYFKMNPGHAM